MLRVRVRVEEANPLIFKENHNVVVIDFVTSLNFKPPAVYSKVTRLLVWAVTAFAW